MTRLTTQEIEAIRKQAELASTGPWEYDASYGNITAPYNDIASDVRYPDAEFIANAREDIPKLLAEVERLKSVIRHVNDCAEEFYEYENGVYVIPQHTPNRDFLQEIFVITAEEVDA